jgi:hypothetical protein
MKSLEEQSILNSISKSNFIREICLDLHCDIKTLKYNCKIYNIPYPNFRKKASCNYDFFDINNLNERSLYWAGFLAADGCVRYNSNSLKLELKTSDKCHIKLFKDHLETSANIHNTILKPSKLLKTKSYKENYYSSNIVLNSKKLCDDLSKFNIVARKTYIYTMPQWLVSHPLVRHFIRGYIDGDGCFAYNKRNEKNTSINLTLTGACVAIEQIYNILKFSCNTKYGDYKKDNDKSRKFYFKSFNDIKNIFEFLYSDATVYLERKYDIAKDIYSLKDKSSYYLFEPQKLQDLYDELGSFAAVAKKLDCDRGVIRHNMISMGLNYKSYPNMRRSRK